MSDSINNLTKGNELTVLIKLALPMLIGNIFQQFYNMVDSIVVGKYVSANALASVGATGSLCFLFFSLCYGMAGGVSILVAQYFGAKDEDSVRATIANAIYLILGIGFLMSVIGVVFSRQCLLILKTPKEILDDAVVYMVIVSFGIVFVALYNVISAILRSLGDSVSSLVFLIISSIINVGLDLLFVIEFNMGVMGVAVATVIAQLFSTVGIFIYAMIKNPYFQINSEQRKLNVEIIKKCIKIGIPVGGQSALIALSCVILQGVVNHFGATVVATFTATSRIEQLVQQPFNSLGTAFAAFTGQNIGAGKIDRVKKGYRKSVLLVAGISCFSLLFMWIFGRVIMNVFVNDKAVIEMGINALQITSCFYFPLGLIYITRNLLNGAGDTIFSMINGITEVIGRVGFATLFLLIPIVGIWGVWYTTALTWLITGTLAFVRYKQGKWRTKSLVKQNDFEDFISVEL